MLSGDGHELIIVILDLIPFNFAIIAYISNDIGFFVGGNCKIKSGCRLEFFIILIVKANANNGIYRKILCYQTGLPVVKNIVHRIFNSLSHITGNFIAGSYGCCQSNGCSAAKRTLGACYKYAVFGTNLDVALIYGNSNGSVTCSGNSGPAGKVG